ncbi:MAG: hypothetical protein M3Y21_04885 [Candidatus Eremiobacteraeota bacterium]|nr:hypothetical protein [Candidatus Eremiobacteraeota bacterium]
MLRLVMSLATAGLIALSLPAIAAMTAPPSISIVTPQAGATIHSSSIPLKVAIRNFNLECLNVGKTNASTDEGHIHVMVDGMDMPHLIAPYCSTSISIPGQGLSAGKHTITAMLANDAHAMNSMPVSVTIDYAPTSPKALPSAMMGGKPSLTILAPKNGATVGKRFNLVMAVSHFDLSCNLEGKKDVEGWGHLHVFVHQNGETTASPGTPMVAMMQTPAGMEMGKMLMEQTHMSTDQLKPLMTMAEPAMIGMPCTKTAPIDLTSWRSGSAQILVQFANNDHMPTMGATPVVVDVKLK